MTINNRFLAKNRLNLKADFTSVFKQGKKFQRGHFLALYKANQKAYARVGIIVSKRFVKKANQRNTIKRMIRESFRLNKSHLIGLDIVILVRSEVQSKTIVRDDLEAIWQSLKNSSVN